MASQPPSLKKQKVEQAKLFEKLNVFVLEQGLGKTRRNIITEQLKKHGANVATVFADHLEYLVISKNLKFERLLKLLKCKNLPNSVVIVDVDWISACLVSGQFEKLGKYQLFTNRNNVDTKSEERKAIGKVEDSTNLAISSSSKSVTETTVSQTGTTVTITIPATTKAFDQLISLKRQIELRPADSSSEEEENEKHKIEHKAAGNSKANLPVIISKFLILMTKMEIKIFLCKMILLRIIVT